MDFHLKQWRDRHESEQQPSAKMPKLLLDPHQPSQQQPQPQQQQQHPLHPSESASALSLLVPAEPNSKISSLSACSDSNTAAAASAATTRFPRMGSYFSLAQWQELELQALIYRYLLAGAAVPPELLQPIRKGLLHSPPYFLHHHPFHPYSHYQPALMLQAGYWGRAAMDPEPGRCRRTDGKKWRCSRDVVAGHKYCERHVHRGRNRSRKPVEIPTPSSAAITTTTTTITASLANGGGGTAVGAGGGGGGCLNSGTSSVAAPSQTAVANGTAMFSLTGQSPSINLLDFSNGASDSKHENKNFIGSLNDSGNRSDGHVLRHFFDDWPRSVHDSDNAAGRGGSNASAMNSATCLSISMPGNVSSDVSLKLSTGDGGEEPGGTRGDEREQEPHLNWPAGWGTNQVTIASMGGPLAEVLRSSTSNSSPTSVLHQLPRGSASETSIVSA